MPDQSSDLLWQASIDDQTLEFFRRFDANVTKLSGTTEAGFKQVDTRISQSGTNIGAVAGLVGGLTAKIVEFGSKALVAFGGFLKESANLRARVDVLGTTLSVIGQKSGYSSDQIAEFEDQVKSMGITTQSTRESMIRMARANIDWAEASKLARIAQDSAVVAGINSSDAFNRLILGIQKMEPELLDELGITLRRSDAYKTYADSLGVSEKALTDVQKQEAILQEIYRQSSVVAGTYDAAMGNVGKQMTSLPRYIEEIQLALGGIFQPAMSAGVEMYTAKLKEVLEWLKANESQLESLGEKLAMVVRKALEVFDQLLTAVKSLPGYIKDAGVGLAELLSKFDEGLSPEEIQERASQLGTYFSQAVTLLATFVAAGVATIREAIRIAIDDVKILYAVFTGGDVSAALQQLENDAASFGDRVKESAREAMQWVGELTGAIESTTEAAEAPVTPTITEAIQQEAPEATDALEQVDKALADLHERMEEDAARRATEEMRRQIEEQLQLSFQIEDIERNHQERISQIMEQYQEQREDNTEQYNDSLADLEKQRASSAIQREQDYQRRLRDIQKNFERDATELARSRNAVELLRRIRGHEQELEDARTNRQDQETEASEAYQEQLDALRQALTDQETELEESLRKQLESAVEAREKEYEALYRNLDRQRQIRELHNKWAEEDRQLAYQKELEQLAEQFAGMEGLTEEGLNGVLSHWEQYLGDLSVVRDEYMRLTAEMAQATQQMAVTMQQAEQWVNNIPGLNRQRPVYNIPGAGGAAGSNLFPSGGMQNSSNLPGSHAGGISGAGGGNSPYGNNNSGGGGLAPWLQNLSDGLVDWLNNSANNIDDWINGDMWENLGQQLNGNIGQAGQLSMPLANMNSSVLPHIPMGGGLSNIPPVTPVPNGTDKRELLVRVVSDKGLEPYMQRVLVNTITEVERNRGT